MSYLMAQNEEHLRLIESLEVDLIELKGMTLRNGTLEDRSIFCILKLDGEEIFCSSAATYNGNICVFGDHFEKEVPKSFAQLVFCFYDQYPGRVARQLGQVKFRKKDILKFSFSESWHRIEPLVNRHAEVDGKVCIELLHDKRLAETGVVNSFKIRVSDYCDLNISGRNTDLFALVCVYQNANDVETKKIRIKKPTRPVTTSVSNPINLVTSAASSVYSSTSSEWASFDLNDSQVRTILRQSQSSNDDSAGGVENSESVTFPQIRVSLWNDIGLVTSYFHGEVRINLNDFLNPSKPDTEKWYCLRPRSAASVRDPASRAHGYMDLGSVLVRINYTVDHILPAVSYAELWTLLLDSLKMQQPWRYTALGVLDVLPNVKLYYIARYLVKIFLHSNEIRPLIRALCVDQLVKCQDINTLFRSNTLACKCVSELMTFVGQQYLLKSLKPCVDKIFLEKKSCEIDPERLANENVDENMQNLIVYTELALSRILDSNHHCPQLLKDTFRLLRECTERQFPHRLEVQWLVLSSFLIHRFFAAALMSPKSFGLRKDNPPNKVSRTLMLISKILQKLSSAVVAGKLLPEKEAFMTPILQRFTDQRHVCAFIKFLDRISCTNGDSSISGESITTLKEGILKERRLKTATCLNFKLRPSTPRYCCLTENEFYWCKEKGSVPVGRISLLELAYVQCADEEFESKLVFQVGSTSSNVYLETVSQIELTEWVCSLKKASKRLRQQQVSDSSQIDEIVIENQLEAVHMIFLQNIEIVRIWRDHIVYEGPCQPDLPDIVKNDAQAKSIFAESLTKILCCVYTLEMSHKDALSKHLKQCKYGSKDMPIGDDNYLLLKSRMRNFAYINKAAVANYTPLSDIVAPSVPPPPVPNAIVDFPSQSSMDVES